MCVQVCFSQWCQSVHYEGGCWTQNGRWWWKYLLPKVWKFCGMHKKKLSTLTLLQWFQPQPPTHRIWWEERKKERSSISHYIQCYTEHQLCLIKLWINTEQALARDIWPVFRLSSWLDRRQHLKFRITIREEGSQQIQKSKQTMKEQHNKLFLCKSTYNLWNSTFTFQIKWKIRSQKQNERMLVQRNGRSSTMLRNLEK